MKLRIDTEMIVTLGEKKGTMPKSYYEKISAFIIEILEAEETVPFFALLEQAEANFSDQLRGNLPWFILHVKQDLEARDIIKVTRDEKRTQWIRLRRKYKERLQNRKLDPVISSY